MLLAPVRLKLMTIDEMEVQAKRELGYRAYAQLAVLAIIGLWRDYRRVNGLE
jgi:hypothetical protein